jgi:hypothetical protein
MDESRGGLKQETVRSLLDTGEGIKETKQKIKTDERRKKKQRKK